MEPDDILLGFLIVDHLRTFNDGIGLVDTEVDIVLLFLCQIAVQSGEIRIGVQRLAARDRTHHIAFKSPVVQVVRRIGANAVAVASSRLIFADPPPFFRSIRHGQLLHLAAMRLNRLAVGVLPYIAIDAREGIIGFKGAQVGIYRIQMLTCFLYFRRAQLILLRQLFGRSKGGIQRCKIVFFVFFAHIELSQRLFCIDNACGLVSSHFLFDFRNFIRQGRLIVRLAAFDQNVTENRVAILICAL